ncbi:MAG: putative metal-dependent phosphoesterase TrpH [Halieaceae bacterium]|jgi:predicted metal-dependent phosphoesterase TrpH
MIIDLHTHSTASDGSLTPIELLQRATEAGVEVLAITDHDTLAGYREVRDLAVAMASAPLLIPGVELSTQWGGANIHILGLNVDPAHPSLLAGLEILATARLQRADKIAERLEKAGLTGALQGARLEAGDAPMCRPHFARYMVSSGFVSSEKQAFDKYLGSGTMGDVKHYWPDLEDVISWIVDAGGTATIAHPLKYRFTATKLRRLVAAFKSSGGRALEVISGRHSKDNLRALTRLCADYDLQASVGSDFHRDAVYAMKLGTEMRLPTTCVPVWESWDLHRGIDS